MRDYIEKACDEIDAAMFSGDAFLDPEHRSELREYMARWERQLKTYDDLGESEPEERRIEISFGKTAYIAGVGTAMLDAIERSPLSRTGTGDGLVYTTYEALEEFVNDAYPEDNPEKLHTEVEIHLRESLEAIDNSKGPDVIGDIVFAL